MKTSRTLIFVSAFIAATLLPVGGSAIAACNGNKPELVIRINDHKLVVAPGRAPLSIPPSEFQNQLATFHVKVRAAKDKDGNDYYQLQPGQVHLRQVLVKEATNGVAQHCGTNNLFFTEPEFDNSSDVNCIAVQIKGDGNIDDEICFDVIVDGVGTMDPRARVNDEDMRLALRPTIREKLDAVDELRELSVSGDGQQALSPMIEEFFGDYFGMTVAEARQFLEDYPLGK